MSNAREGTRIPDITFRTRVGQDWVDVTTREIFDGKKVVVFSLPGAFTPTCSASHLPRYEQLAPAFRAAGVDEIVCVSVNDAFVMNAWCEDQGACEVRMIPDGNGEFTEAMGMLVDKADLGFGRRSWRYSMLVEDGVVTRMFVEPDKPGDPFEVSDADTMLDYVTGQADSEAVTVFARPGCPHCARAKRHLAEAGLRFEEIVVGRDASDRALKAVSGRTQVPQIFVGGSHIGGADELEVWLAARKAA
jgi:glutaredoxin-like protein